MRPLHRVLVILGALALVLLPADRADSWESVAEWTIDVPLMSFTHGRPNARVYYDSEHRNMFQIYLGAAGLPTEWNAEHTFWVPTDDEPTWYTSPTLLASGEPYTLIPVDFVAAERYRDRDLIPSMLSELPDFSYSLFDWMSGNETCPPAPPSTTGDDCYEFGGWMGSLNSTHFVPQATILYLAYHDLAVNLAEQCLEYQTDMGYGTYAAGPIPAHLSHVLDCGRDGLCSDDENYPGADEGELDGVDDFLEQCMVQALMVEAVGHHFFEDSWSSGHMWHRWGGPHPANFPNLHIGLATAMTSGMIHGARSITGRDDRMCQTNQWRYAWGATLGAPLPAGHPVYQVSGDPYGVYGGVGDMYYGDMAGLQDTMLQECSVVSICEVYQGGAQIWGPASCSTSTITASGDARCHDQRATNDAIWQGSSLQMGWLGTYPLGGVFVRWTIRNFSDVDGGAYTCPPSTAATEEDCVNAELARVQVGYQAAADLDPNGISLATNTAPLGVGTFMGIGSNDAYYGLPSYSDSFDAPWDGGEDKELHLLRGLHRANAKYWCDNMTHEDVYALRSRCQNDSLDSDVRETACLLCEEFAGRMLRIGCSPDEHTDDRQPLCNYLSDTPDDVDYVYLDRSPAIPLTADLGTASGDFCRTEWDLFSANPIGPCLDPLFIGSYDNAYCTAMWYPYFMCFSCSQCYSPGWAHAGLETQWEYADLPFHYWDSPDASGYIPTSTWEDESTDVYPATPLWPPSCFYTDSTVVSVEFTACDPHMNCNTRGAVDLFECYGAAY